MNGAWLADTEVTIHDGVNSVVCGRVPSSTAVNTWYEVTCSPAADGSGYPLGTEVRLTTTTSTYL